MWSVQTVANEFGFWWERKKSLPVVHKKASAYMERKMIFISLKMNAKSKSRMAKNKKEYSHVRKKEKVHPISFLSFSQEGDPSVTNHQVILTNFSCALWYNYDYLTKKSVIFINANKFREKKKSLWNKYAKTFFFCPNSREWLKFYDKKIHLKKGF